MSESIEGGNAMSQISRPNESGTAAAAAVLAQSTRLVLTPEERARAVPKPYQDAAPIPVKQQK
ncbi:hypothetical protein A2368_04535 [Candidatus Collierbacteria bacterium RIFOXYB1_FULL_49_13]|uniref:Uncharacterized protein n=1 Tax=Candidatus Collierbacteria bacterium RIFOXYB1_FULL_49_13 TaxID=1817728 RepID=A0A1F5FGX1_9BACT|nr:MAG: hypothetical protein A2368_04535 [Candidatus Collierbacteria bacterium RIFOXYB1_FULL_49_13]